MKPRRWYSGPEVNPHPQSTVNHPSPAAIYWAFTTRTWREQGAIIRQNPPLHAANEQRGRSAVVVVTERVRRTEAA
ncbi:MAG: hypothetical protein AB4911_10240 [Oscillochloridaceae bacterium umkhey_bin13]